MRYLPETIATIPTMETPNTLCLGNVRYFGPLKDDLEVTVEQVLSHRAGLWQPLPEGISDVSLSRKSPGPDSKPTRVCSMYGC